MKNKIFSAVSILLLLFTVSFAWAHPAQELIEKSTLEAFETLSKDKEKLQNDPEYLKAFVEEKLIPHIDFKSMTGMSIGKHWRKANAEQRDALTSEFKLMLQNTYMKALTLYSDQKMTFKPFIAGKRDDRAVVKALFVEGAGKGIPVNYKLRKKDDGWKIYNIEVNSISLVSTYRGAFSQKINQSGIDGLIEEMRSRNAKAKEG